MGTVSVTYISQLFIRSNNLAHFFLISLFGRPSFAFRMVIALAMPVVHLFLDLSPFSVHFAIYLGGVWKVCLPEIPQWTEVVMEIWQSRKQASCNLSYLLKSRCTHPHAYTYNHVYPVHYWMVDTLTSPYSIDINANFMFVHSEISLPNDTSLALHLENNASVFSMLSRAIPPSNTSPNEHIFRQTSIYIGSSSTN